MRTFRLLTAIAAVLIVFIATQLLASAHHVIVKQGNDEASISADHKTGYVCDKEYDGETVTAIFWYADGSDARVVDPDGDGVPGPGHNGCWQIPLTKTVDQIMVCEGPEHASICRYDDNP
jgi:hypothetical protein